MKLAHVREVSRRRTTVSTSQVRPKDEPNMLISTVREVSNKLAAIEQLRILFTTARSLFAAVYDSGSISCYELTYLHSTRQQAWQQTTCMYIDVVATRRITRF